MGFPAILSELKADVTRVSNESSLHSLKLDMLIVGADQIADQPFRTIDDVALCRKWESGARSSHKRVFTALAGYRVVQRQTSRIPMAKESISSPPTGETTDRRGSTPVSANGTDLVSARTRAAVENLLTRPVLRAKTSSQFVSPPMSRHSDG